MTIGYRSYLRHNMFFKMIAVFCLIIIMTIVTLSYMTFYFLSQSAIRNELENQRKAMEQVNAYIDEKHDSVQSIIQNIYRDQLLSMDVTYLLNHTIQEYYSYRLDQFYLSGSSGSSKALEYFGRVIDDDSDVENLILYSAEKQFIYVNQQSNLPKIIPVDAAHSYIPDLMSLQQNLVSVPNTWMRKAIGQSNPRLYTVQGSLTEKDSFKNIGNLLVYFNSDAILRALGEYEGTMKGYIVALTPDGDVLFDSSGNYYDTKYPYIDLIESLSATVTLEEKSYMTTLATNKDGYMVVGVIPKREIAASYESLKNVILLISLICIVIAIIVPSLFVINYAKRTERIIRFMRKAETGDMSVRIQDSKQDQMGQISRSFNQMLTELNSHIDRVYVAEIKQKHTELAALQARVNPHFLYNTLESIRMRALSQGATDVGDMIYNLAFLFRSFVRQQDRVTLREELANCSKYLELFRIRYKDKFSYVIELEDGIGELEVLKMSLQPIVENYVIHGIRKDRNDNVVTIRGTHANGLVQVEVKDNGIGIDSGKLVEIRQSFHVPEADHGDGSFGLRSVHERFRLAYGLHNGLDIVSEAGVGTTVTIWFPDPRERS